jgi:hypothetical protein
MEVFLSQTEHLSVRYEGDTKFYEQKREGMQGDLAISDQNQIYGHCRPQKGLQNEHFCMFDKWTVDELRRFAEYSE